MLPIYNRLHTDICNIRETYYTVELYKIMRRIESIRSSRYLLSFTKGIGIEIFV